MLLRLLAVLLIVVSALSQEPAQAGRRAAHPASRNDSQSWLRDLSKAYPAGASPQQRKDADQQAAAALARKDNAAAVTALERRIGMGEASGDALLNLARLYAERSPPDWRRSSLPQPVPMSMPAPTTPRLQPLLLIARALRNTGLSAEAIPVLEAVVQRADTAENKALLADAQRAAGMRLRTVRLEPEAEPARACVAFTVPPSRRTDFQPQDGPARPGCSRRRRHARSEGDLRLRPAVVHHHTADLPNRYAR